MYGSAEAAVAGPASAAGWLMSVGIGTCYRSGAALFDQAPERRLLGKQMR